MKKIKKCKIIQKKKKTMRACKVKMILVINNKTNTKIAKFHSLFLTALDRYSRIVYTLSQWFSKTSWKKQYIHQKTYSKAHINLDVISSQKKSS